MIYSLKSKKANIGLEVLTILLLCVIFAIGSLWAYKVFDDLNSDIQADDDMSLEGKAVSNNLFVRFPKLMDNLFLLMFSLFTVFVIVSVFLIDTHPIFFVIAFILLISVFVASIFVGNVYNDIATDDELSSYANNMPYMSFIMRHIVEMVVAIGFITAVAMFIKLKG